jgi:hypothetical protein
MENTMSEAMAVVTSSAVPSPAELQPFALLPWRDPQTVSPGDLSVHIQRLEQLCLEYPKSADLRTCLGMAYAVGFDVYKSMDALEAATSIDPQNFWAQLKYAELHYRLRTLRRAEEESLKAVALARSPFQLSLARKQLQEVRSLLHHSARNVHWNKPLTVPAVAFSLMLVTMFVAMMWK